VNTVQAEKVVVGSAAASSSVAIVVKKEQIKWSSAKQDASKSLAPSKAEATDIAAKKQQPAKAIPFDKEGAVLLGISAKDLTVLTSTKPKKISDTQEKKVAAKKIARQPISDTNTQLLEKVAVEFIQQDLDRLLPQ